MTVRNIYLIGFMGSGKSYLGKGLAEILNRSFVDLDAYLEVQEGKTISQIFQENGEATFRELEKKYLLQTIDFKNTIIATGGGTPCFYDNMEWMSRVGLTIFLKVPTSVLVHRLSKEKAHRPLLTNQTDEELADFIEQKLMERMPYYEQAKIIFNIKTGYENADDLRTLIESNS